VVGGQKLTYVTNAFEHDHKLSRVRRARPKQDTGEQPEESYYMMLASSKGSHEIVSQLLQFGGVAGYPIIDVLNNPAYVALRPPLGFLKETRAVSHENAEIVRAGCGNG